MKLFNFLSRKADTRPVIEVNAETLYRQLFETWQPYIKLKRDSDLIDTITDGYENSPDVFSIVNRVSTMFSQIPYKVFKGETEVDIDPLKEFFDNDSINKADYTFTEFRQNWQAMAMVTGNAITFHVLRSGTADKILQFQIMPTQHVEIMYGGWLNPVGGYKLDLAPDGKEAVIPPEQVWHVRIFPNMDYREGKNFMGLSPIRVAARIINSQVFGQELIEASYKRGMPPGILTKKDATWEMTAVEEQRKSMEEIWDRKYGNRSKAGKPVFTVGDLAWLPLGFSNFTDLQIEQINKLSLRTLCNVWGIPSRIMNDMEGGAYTKDKEDRKAIYTNRLIPDNRMFWDGINKLIANTGLRYEPDYAAIPELQEDKKEMAQIFQIGYNANSVQVNEFRDQLGLEPDPQMEGLYRNDVETNPVVNEPLPPEKL